MEDQGVDGNAFHVLCLFSPVSEMAPICRMAQGAVLFPVILWEEKDSSLNSRWNRLVLSEHGRACVDKE